MGDAGATLELRGASWAWAEEHDEAFALLESSGLPLAWLSLLDVSDLQRQDWWEGGSTQQPVRWADQVHAAFADPDHERLPPLEVPWTTARARVQAAVTWMQQRGDPWAAPLQQWAEWLDALAAQGPTQRVLLWPGPPEQTTAAAYLEVLTRGVRWWRDPDGAPRPPLVSEAGLTGRLDLWPTWHPERHPPEERREASPRTTRERGVDAGWVLLLSMVTLMAFWLTGSVWVGAAVFVLASAGIAWSVVRQARQDAIPSLRLRPGAGPITVRPPLLTVLVTAALLLGGLVELWGQLHRVQGPCCSRAYYNYGPSREWDTIWVVLAAISLGVVSQTVRVADGRVRVTWLFGLLRRSRPLESVAIEPVTAQVPRSRERRVGLRLLLGWLGVTVTEDQAGYAELLRGCEGQSAPEG